MKLITPKKEFDKKKSTEEVLCECLLCKNHFNILKKEVTRELNNNNGYVKFCSKSCAAKYTNPQKTLSIHTKNKISNSLIKFNEGTPKLFYMYKCENCNFDFEGTKIRSGRKVTCEKCKKRRLVKNINDINSIYEVSLRTMQKIIKRANIKCAICDWDKTTLDMHHIHGRKNSDITIRVCCNCHREIHRGTRMIK